MSWLASLQEHVILYHGFLAALGAIAGSFASAAAYRIPREGMSVARPARSRCPHCGAGIRWHDNLPILSWVLLRGRCRDCGARFGAGYLLHEAGLAALFVTAGRGWAADPAAGGGLWALILTLVALTALWIAAAVDLRHLILPDAVTLGGIPFGFLAAALVPAFHLWPGRAGAPPGVSWLGLGPADGAVTLALASALLGSAISFLALIGIRSLFSYLLRQEALGLGDVKYLAAVGAFLGLEGSLWTLLIGVFAGAIVGLVNAARMILVVARRRRRRGSTLRYAHSALRVGWLCGRTIPFGPTLILGTVIVLLDPSGTHRFFLETWPRLVAG